MSFGNLLHTNDRSNSSFVQFANCCGGRVISTNESVEVASILLLKDKGYANTNAQYTSYFNCGFLKTNFDQFMEPSFSPSQYMWDPHNVLSPSSYLSL